MTFNLPRHFFSSREMKLHQIENRLLSALFLVFPLHFLEKTAKASYFLICNPVELDAKFLCWGTKDNIKVNAFLKNFFFYCII